MKKKWIIQDPLWPRTTFHSNLFKFSKNINVKKGKEELKNSSCGNSTETWTVLAFDSQGSDGVLSPYRRPLLILRIHQNPMNKVSFVMDTKPAFSWIIGNITNYNYFMYILNKGKPGIWHEGDWNRGSGSGDALKERIFQF